MEDLHAAIATYLRDQRPGPARRKSDPAPRAVESVAIYARVAAINGGGTSSLDDQEAACRAFAQDQGYEVILAYREVAHGMTLDRHQLTALRAAIAHGWYTIVLLTGLARLTRDTELLQALRAEWAAVGVRIVVVGPRGDDAPRTVGLL